ncbi:HlyD family type I secretion periplasmic adaptor subunit [Phytohalomonas tamaricis]|uniref:HlyD family type I secretion periplasmic adaptor subunit n=1 Tax=Phytohalomonas tamaricis TaxID=2081032 RepID=UPI000D0BC4AB|nr:HlyD family type I secretion periplasmic adaptor subunit [Phytohalomonas tamaricis]
MTSTDYTNSLPVGTSVADSGSHLPTSDKSYRRLGYAILLVAFGGFGTWAALAQLAIAVIAPGTVAVEAFKKTVQHFEGGIVSHINVSDGDHVEAGQTLLVLDDTQARSQLAISKSAYFIARAQEARLLAEQQGNDTLSFPKALRDAAAQDERLQQILTVQQGLFLARRSSLRGEIESLQAQASQMQEQIDGLSQTIAINRQRIASLEDEAADYRSLFKEGLGNNQRIRELERQIMQYRSDTAQARADIAQLKSQISENKVNIEVRRQDYQQEIGEQLRAAQAEISDAQERIVALSDQVRRTTIIAPTSGTVVGLDVHTLGAVIQAGTPIMDIIPDSGGFVVEAHVPVKDIDNIYAGQHAEIRFSAFNQRLTNVIEGEIVHVSADSFTDEATGTSYYKARVKVTEQGQRAMNSEMQLLAGMPAEVMIQTGDKTLMQYITQPIADMMARAMREE